jgi:hypothetical protein
MNLFTGTSIGTGDLQMDRNCIFLLESRRRLRVEPLGRLDAARTASAGASRGERAAAAPPDVAHRAQHCCR